MKNLLRSSPIGKSHDVNQPVQVFDKVHNLLRFEVVNVRSGTPSVLCDDGEGDDGVPNCRRQAAIASMNARDVEGNPQFCVRERLQDWQMNDGRRVRALNFPVLDASMKELIGRYAVAYEAARASAPSAGPAIETKAAPKKEAKNV